MTQITRDAHCNPTTIIDALGNRTTLTSPQGIATVAYGALSRRTALTLPNGSRATYMYDVASQLTRLLNQGPGASHLATGQVHDAANRLLEDSQFTYTYDATGNLTTKTSRATGARTVYTYSVENQLTQVDQFTLAGGPTPVLTATYRYDPLGRRIAKEVTQGATPTTTRYIYDNEDSLLELDGANVLQARFTHGPGIDEPLIMLRGGQNFFYHADGLGSIWDLTDSTGTVPKSYTYDSFGNILTQPGTVANPYTYTGRELDPETGLYYYRARHYDPSAGRFLSEDPIAPLLDDPQSLNEYIYVQNSAPNSIDPFGLQRIVLPVNLDAIQRQNQAMRNGLGFLPDAILDLFFPLSREEIAEQVADSFLICPVGKIDGSLRGVLRRIGKLERVVKSTRPGTNPGEIKEIVKFVDRLTGGATVVLHEVRDAAGRILHRDIKFVRPSK